MTRVMYDAITVDQIPGDATAVAGYIDGDWPTFSKLSHFKANKLSITVHASTNAACLDVEPGDATAAEVGSWVRRQLDRGQYKPVIYASRDNMPGVLHALQSAGIDRSRVRLWSAHYGVGAHICSGISCGASFTADATQWTDAALGRSLDESLLSDSFFPGAPKRKTIPKPKLPTRPHPKVTAATVAGLIVTAITAALHAAGASITPAEATAITTAAAGLTGYWYPVKASTK